MQNALPWLEIIRGTAPLVISMPHTGSVIPDALIPTYKSRWLAQKDTDWWIERLYDFAVELGATTVRTHLSRSVIDVNRDPSGLSLYPGQNTTTLCPLSTFDGEPLCHPGYQLDDVEIKRRLNHYFKPYHETLATEINRLRQTHDAIVIYDCHSIRSVVSTLFEGVLPNFNIGSNSGKSCAATLTRNIEKICAASGLSHVVDGRFKGGYITRLYGNPESGVHAVQIELACRGYMDEPAGKLTEVNWPPAYNEKRASPLKITLRSILAYCIDFARSQGHSS